MTLAEFKAWFEGYAEGMKGPPSVKQWNRIKARVNEIDGTFITNIHNRASPVYFDRSRSYLPYVTYPDGTWGSLTTTSNYGGAIMGRQDAEADA